MSVRGKKRSHTPAGAVADRTLVAEWEAKLAKEGLGVVWPLTKPGQGQHGLVVVPNPVDADDDWACRAQLDLTGVPLSLANTDTARSWRAFSQAIWTLPKGFFTKRRIAFLHCYAEHAICERAAREAGISIQTARTTLAQFAKWRKGQVRTSPDMTAAERRSVIESLGRETEC